MKKNKTIIIILLLSFVSVAIVCAWAFSLRKKPGIIRTFADCVQSGKPIIETYPEQCSANGKTFTNPDQKAIPPNIVN